MRRESANAPRDPAGRFFDNTDGSYRYSRPILDVGIETGWRDIRFSMALFERRGGHYEIGSPGGRRLPLAGE